MTSGGGAAGAEWAFVVADPVCKIEARGDIATIDGAAAPAPFDAIRERLNLFPRNAAWEVADIPCPPFRAGLLGFVGYEAGALLEPSLALPPSPHALPDIAFGEYAASASFHLPTRRTFVYGRNAFAAQNLADRLGRNASSAYLKVLVDFLSVNMDRADYQNAVEVIREKIRDGAFYQANIARTLEFEMASGAGAYDLFLRTYADSSARFCAFLSHSDGAIVSISPERFFEARPCEAGTRILAEPIKGTRPRHADPIQDAAAIRELQSDPKERAENIMIADLIRNDLSRVCGDASIREDFIARVVSYASVHHLVSGISGLLRENLAPLDAFMSLFPCGSITGAPKVAVMRAIAEIESRGRGPYCGAIGFFDSDGGAHFSVAIRTATFDASRRRFVAPVGGGVTLRSSPAAEFDETRAKVRWLTSAKGVDVRGLD